MRPMTHGEIRGTIVLLILLAAIVLSAALLRGCPRESGLPAASHRRQPTPQAVDSLRMEMSASRYDDSSTVKSGGKPPRDTVAARASDAKSRKKQRKATSSRRPSPSPTPSPLDRPI